MNNIQENTCLKNEKKRKEEKSKSNEISLIFRNQLSNDTILRFSNSNLSLLKISDITEQLLSKLNKSKTDSFVRLFFKGRPLKEDEKMKDLCKQIIK